jgi:hypothetical protein
MKKHVYVLSVLILAVLSLTIASPSPLLSCTMFAVDTGDTILVGNNEDDITPFTEIRFIPATPGKYGCFYLAFKDIQGIQSAMNERGLIFDIFMAPRLKVQNSKGKIFLDPEELYMKVMESCATIDQVIKMLDLYNLEFLEPIQLMFVDASGDWAIVEGDIILRKTEKKPFQVITNFFLSQVTKESDITCRRYQLAHKMLSSLQNQGKFTKNNLVKILAAVHQEWRMGGTLYSNIYDLKNRRIYLYHNHNFLNEVVLDLDQELKKGKRKMDLSALFPTTFAYEEHKSRYVASRRQAIDMDPKVSDQYLGIYQYQSGRQINIVKEKRMFYVSNNKNKYEILPEAENKFFFKDLDILLSFIKDSSGKVIDMILHFNRDRKAKKIEKY